MRGKGQVCSALFLIISFPSLKLAGNRPKFRSGRWFELRENKNPELK